MGLLLPGMPIHERNQTKTDSVWDGNLISKMWRNLIIVSVYETFGWQTFCFIRFVYKTKGKKGGGEECRFVLFCFSITV